MPAVEVAVGAGKPADVLAFRVADPAAHVIARIGIHLPGEKEEVHPAGVPGEDAVGFRRGECRGVGSGRIGHRYDLQRSGHVGKLGLLGKVPGAQVHVHAIGQEVVAAGIAGRRADKDRTGAGLKLPVRGEDLLVGLRGEVGGQRVEPIFRAVDLGERLDALAAAGQVVFVVVGILAEGEPPLAQVADALG